MEVGFSFPSGGPRQAPPWGVLLRDPSLLAILAGNLLALGVALVQQWPLGYLLWPYWLQSLAIGWYARLRMLSLERFSTEGFTIDDQPVAPTEATLVRATNFFVLHYGLFHAVYFAFLVFLGAEGKFGEPPRPSDYLLFLLLGVAFAIGHRHSHRRNLAADTRSERNLGAVMFLPYLRIVPMHATILFGATLGAPEALLLFAGLKFGADLTLHVVEHRWLQSVPRPDMSGAAPRRDG
jgi:hypothetical protein